MIKKSLISAVSALVFASSAAHAGSVSAQCAADAAYAARVWGASVFLVSDHNYPDWVGGAPVGQWNANANFSLNKQQISTAIVRPETLLAYMRGGMDVGVNQPAHPQFTNVFIKAGFIVNYNSLRSYAPGSRALATVGVRINRLVGSCYGF